MDSGYGGQQQTGGRGCYNCECEVLLTQILATTAKPPNDRVKHNQWAHSHQL